MILPAPLRDCVVFIGTRDADGKFVPRATGFVVAIEDHGSHWSYLVTAEHVIAGFLNNLIEMYVQVSLKGSRQLFNFGPIAISAWKFHPNNAEVPADIAVAVIDCHEFEITPIDITPGHGFTCTQETINELGIGPGVEIAVVGLFRNHYGKERAIPVVRIGHLSTLREEPVNTKFGDLDAYLVEVMSIGGLSGSPVFVNRLRSMDLPNGEFWMGSVSHFLGVMHGHFDVKELNSDAVDGSAPQGSINSGIGVVVPVEKIIDIITAPEMSDERRKAADRIPANPDDPCHCRSGRPYKYCHGAKIGSVVHLDITDFDEGTQEELRQHFRELKTAKRAPEPPDQ